VRSVLGGRSRGRRVLLAGVLATLTLACMPEPTLGLPAGWSYELVSPTDPLQSSVQYGAASPEGNHAWFVTITPVIEGQPSGNVTTVGATRVAGMGWQGVSLADPGFPGSLLYTFDAAAEDASRVIVQSCDELLLGCRGDVTFQRLAQDGSRTIMLRVPRTSLPTPVPRFAGNSADVSWIFVQNADAASGVPPLLAADTHVEGQGLYASHNGQVEFLGFDPNGAVLPCGEILANNVVTNGNGSGFEQNGLSADGSTVVFESPDPTTIDNDPTDCPGPVDVYVRRGSQSVDISAPRSPNPDLGATYVGNSQDGNTVYFVSASQLVASDTDTDPDIYAYDVPSDTIARITPDANVTDAGSGAFSVAVSPSGDFVYFEALNQINGQGTAGQVNLYMYHAGTITFIATGSASHFTLGHPLTNGEGSPLTPDGRHLVFLSSDPLTGQPTGGRRMIFQYTFGAGIKCVSCRPDGASPFTSLDDRLSNNNVVAQVDQRIQSDDGHRVFFDTLEPLTAQDISPARDVYVWENDGTLRGRVALISGGESRHNSSFVGASTDGNSVFFTTTDRLLPAVHQDTLKLYVARLGGGFPSPSATTAACTDDGCQPQPATPPSLRSVATATVNGPRNHFDHVPTLTIDRITRAAKLKLVRTGRITLTLHTNTPTAIRVTLTARIHGRWITTVTTTRMLKNAAATRIVLRLNARARADLTAHHSLRLHVTITTTNTQPKRLIFTVHTTK
jgi:hypothetical protein